VKNLVDVLAFIGALVDDENLVDVTLNGLGKDYGQFCNQLQFEKHFPISKT
jgi:hypothetical protein